MKWVLALATAMAVGSALTGCTLTAGAPSRTLDPEIRRVYVPQATNNSTRFGMGPRVTTALQDAILSDGRLELVSEPQADARIEVTLSDYDERILATSDDDYPLVSEKIITATADLWDPYKKVRTVPLARRQVVGRYTFVSDPRRILTDTATDADQRLAETVARALLQNIITGPDLPPSPSQQRALEREMRVNGPTQVIPEIDPTRLPDSSKIPVRL
jgi:hypothetical protein